MWILHLYIKKDIVGPLALCQYPALWLPVLRAFYPNILTAPLGTSLSLCIVKHHLPSSGWQMPIGREHNPPRQSW